MKELQFEGKKYIYVNNKFLNEDFSEVPTNLRRILAKVFFVVDYKTLPPYGALEYLKEVKKAGEYKLACEICEYLMETYPNDVNLVRGFLSIWSSSYRMLKQPAQAVKLEEYVLKNASLENCSFYTSLAAAYCDLNDIDSAINMVKYAYALRGWNKGTKFELISVMKRIKSIIGDQSEFINKALENF